MRVISEVRQFFARKMLEKLNAAFLSARSESDLLKARYRYLRLFCAVKQNDINLHIKYSECKVDSV